ncbi:MAG: trypsin-like serine protease [Candidatus Omnitrophota bacterium]|nr:trypsin-like serine protease [Candidatus Omnitrophota bacterium]
MEQEIFAILKLSYNKQGDTAFVGGICGTGFRLNDNTVITANHILNQENFKPNEGYNKCKYWLITQEGKSQSILKEDLISFPDIDTTFIMKRNKESNATNIKIPNIKETGEIEASGHIAGLMPTMEVKWIGEELEISNVNLINCKAEGTGIYKYFRNKNITAADLKIQNSDILELSFGGVEGMSGGPVFENQRQNIIGMMSGGFPPGLKIKTILFAVPLNEIIKRFNKIKAEKPSQISH